MTFDVICNQCGDCLSAEWNMLRTGEVQVEVEICKNCLDGAIDEVREKLEGRTKE
jgi:NADH:ubiquinone oxidoreductase subunit D